MAEKVLDKEELSALKDLQVKTNGFLFDLGLIESQIQFAEQSKNAILENLSKLKVEESELGNKLKEKYGEGSVDLESGKFISSN
jgi:hypothetical protein|tara:strand:- start:108 stop:359 length:252 start_codon:yes stop_codon:yes gene_type:complete